jgi:PiT family inorganic phosphate transporter
MDRNAGPACSGTMARHQPEYAVGVLVGAIAVAYALVELLPAEVLSPPDGGPAVAMLVALFVAALSWNIGTW